MNAPERLQIDLNVLGLDPLHQIQRQHPHIFQGMQSVDEVALHIRDELNLKRCTRVLDTLIFTQI